MPRAPQTESPPARATADVAQHRRQSLRALWAASAFGGFAQALAGTAGGLLARVVSGSDAVAGLPQAMLVAGSAIAAVTLSRLTRRSGRGRALGVGAAAATAGCLVAAGAASESLRFVLVGSLLLGAGNTAVMLGRYAAADLAPMTARARTMATVLAATTVGAVAGPNLLAPTGALARDLGLSTLSGPYLVAAMGFAVAAVTYAFGVRAPAAVDPTNDARAVRSTGGALPASLPQSAAAGLLVLTLTNLVMVAVMTMAPVHLHQHGGGLVAIGVVVSAHIAGMFAPSPLSGWLTDSVGGAMAAVLAGAVLVAACALAAVGSDSTTLITVALVLLGVGWNIGLVAGSTLLTAGVLVHDRIRREGWGELGMGVAAAGGAAVSGTLTTSGGYPLLAAAGAAAAVLIVPVARLGSHRP